MNSRSLVNRFFVDEDYVESDLLGSAKTYVSEDSADSLQRAIALGFSPGDLSDLCSLSARSFSVNCLRVLLEHGVPCAAHDLHSAARANRFDIVEVALTHGTGWCPRLPGVAAGAGNVRFLMRVFEAGCPTWACAHDGEPIRFCDAYYPSGMRLSKTRASVLEDWSLVVSSDLVRSGPVLLYAAQKGAPLTLRMRGMLKNVRGRALALAGCFHRAAHHGPGPEGGSRELAVMARVPTELIQQIATLAKISIVAGDFVE